jgi:hypothetical protein
VICPFATYRPISVNHGGLMGPVYGLVLHVQQGDNSLYGYFSNPVAQASSHFWCSKTGALEQYLDTTTVAWAEAAGNSNYLSVETEGYGIADGPNPATPLTDAQINTLAELLDWCALMYGFPVAGPVAHGARGFTPHCNPDGTPDPNWGNHPCPGPIRLGQMPAIVAAAKPQPIPTQEDEMNAVVLPNGQVKIYAADPKGHLLEFTRTPGQQSNDVRDVTTQIGLTANNGGPFLVAP